MGTRMGNKSISSLQDCRRKERGSCTYSVLAFQSELATGEMKVADVCGSEALDEIFLDATCCGHDGIDQLMLAQVTDGLAYSAGNHVGRVPQEDGALDALPIFGVLGLVVIVLLDGLLCQRPLELSSYADESIV